MNGKKKITPKDYTFSTPGGLVRVVLIECVVPPYGDGMLSTAIDSLRETGAAEVLLDRQVLNDFDEAADILHQKARQLKRSER